MDNTAIVSVQEQKQLQLLNNGLITADRFINKNYLINIASAKNGIGGLQWIHIDGFSENVLNYIINYEKLMLNFNWCYVNNMYYCGGNTWRN